MWRNLLVALAVAALLAGSQLGCEEDNRPSLIVGMTVEDVEKQLGEPLSVLPNFGRELRAYKGKTGHKYLITYEDGKVVEIAF